MGQSWSWKPGWHNQQRQTANDDSVVSTEGGDPDLDVGEDFSVRLRLDKYKVRTLLAAALCWACGLTAAMLLGLLGPTPFESTVWYAYGCPDGSHVWSNDCVGVDLTEPNTVWNQNFTQLETLNRFWSLSLTAYNKFYSDGRDRTVNIQVSLNMSYSRDGTSWSTEVQNDVHECTVKYESGSIDGECLPILLIFKSPIEHPSWAVSVQLPDADKSEASFLGDVKFEFKTGTTTFSDFEISITIFFIAGSCIVFTVLIFVIRSVPLRLWTLEQKFIVILQFGLIFYNNPFYTLKWFPTKNVFTFWNAFVKISFLSLLCLFWLFCCDRVKQKSEVSLDFGLGPAIKIGLVLCFLASGLGMYIWQIVAAENDPVYGISFDIAGVMVLFVITIILFFGIVLWLGVVSIISIKDLRHNMLLLKRYLYLVLPTFVVLCFSIASIFTGTFVALGSTAVGLVLFYTLYNSYVGLLIFGYAPRPPKEPREESELESESSSLVSFTRS
ncbi:transmembrane protein [Pelomyxa schiedti]|nr:transmembrane protein [Pelomyxa schiedti]